MSELQTIEAALETFLAKAEGEAEVLLAQAAAAIKNTLTALANSPEVQKALKDGMQDAIAAVAGAAQAGGTGAIAGAIAEQATLMMKDVEVAAKPALIQIVQGEIAAAVTAPTAAIPANPNN